MGIVRKQGILSALVIYAGFGFGALNLLVLFTKFFTPEQMGLTRVLFAIANILVQLALFGIIPTMSKFTPFYRDYLKPKENDLYSRAFGISTFGFLLISLLSWIFKAEICDYFINRSPLIVVYYNLIYPLTYGLLIFTILETISSVNLKTVLANTLREVGVRLITTIILLITIVGWVDFDSFVILYSILMYGIPSIVLAYYLIKKGDLTFSFTKSKVTRRISGKMISFAMFSYGGMLIFVISQQADSLFIASIVGLASTSIYMIADYLTTLIQVPARSLINIVIPLFARAWKDRDMVQIKLLYQKTALNQLIAGLFIFGAVWCGIDFVLAYMGDAYQYSKTIIAVLGCARIVDLAFGPNNELLHTSNHWKFNFFSLVLLMAAFIPANVLFIKSFGPVGAAYSNFIAFFLYNLVRFIFIYYKYRIHPFTVNFMKVFLIFAFALSLTYLVPKLDILIVTSILKGIIFTTAVICGIIIFKPSEDINDIGNKMIKKYIKR